MAVSKIKRRGGLAGSAIGLWTAFCAAGLTLAASMSIVHFLFFKLDWDQCRHKACNLESARVACRAWRECRAVRGVGHMRRRDGARG